MNLTNTNIDNIVIHKVGNKLRDEALLLSSFEISVSNEIKEILFQYFLSPFQPSPYKRLKYQAFHHDTEIGLNEVYRYVSEVFADKTQLYQQSINLAKHLYKQSNHPNIKSGELCVVYFTNCEINLNPQNPDQFNRVSAVGLFKSENKDTFLKLTSKQLNNNSQTDLTEFLIEAEQGISIEKLDKGCLIFNTEAETGYQVLVIDNTNKGNEAHYWVHNFLQVQSKPDAFNKTEETLAVYKQFITEELPTKQDVSKTDQADYLARSIDFFENNDTFTKEAFAAEVMQSPEMIDYFEAYKTGLSESDDVKLEDNFSISDKALKKQARYFRSVIKLDKNFHIYVHGQRKKIEQGSDEKGKYYKLYYDEES